MDVTEFLGRLSETPGLSGYETGVQSVVIEEFRKHADEVRTDVMGNVIALKRGAGPEPRHSIMLAAHMDEIGLIVSQIKEGFLQFGTVGGFDQRVLLGQPVTVHGRRDLPGIIGSRPPHVLSPSERDKVIPRDELFIDVGLPAEQVAQVVRVGDVVSLRARYLRLRGDLVAGKAFDDRAGVAAVAACLEALSGLRPLWDTYAVATTQEEVGLRGATTSAYGLAPDIGIAIDVGFAPQAGVPESLTIPIGKGAGVTVGPNVHPGMFKRFEEVARQYELPFSVDPAPGHTGTDGWAMQVAREGVPTMVLSIPVKSMHTPVEMLSTKDVLRTGRLMALFIASLDDRFLEELRWPLPKDEVAP